MGLSVVIQSIKGKGDITNCSRHRPKKHLQHGVKVMVQMVKENLLKQRQLTKQFGLMHEKGTIYALFMLTRLKKRIVPCVLQICRWHLTKFQRKCWRGNS